jgi:hypothetical protein
MANKAFKKQSEQESILNELESIKELLDDGELIHDEMEIPTLEEVIEDIADEVEAKATDKGLLSETATHNQSDDDAEDKVTDDLIERIPTEVKIEAISVETTPEEVAPEEAAPKNSATLDETEQQSEVHVSANGVLPGQQSLFEENKPENKTEENQLTEKPQETTHSSNTSQTHLESSDHLQSGANAANKTVENPFLPKHIRERLNGMADVPAYEQQNIELRKNYHNNKQLAQQASATANKLTSVTNTKDESLKSEVDDMVDSLIKEFMPIIEAKLRLVLKEKATKSLSTKNDS